MRLTKKYLVVSLVVVLMLTATGFTNVKSTAELKTNSDEIEINTFGAPQVGEYFQTQDGVSGVKVAGNYVATWFEVLSQPGEGKNGTVSITSGIVDEAAIQYTLTGELYIPESIIYEGNEYDIVSIGDYAFAYCGGLTCTGLETNSTVKTIGESAYIWLYDLESTGLGNNSSVTTIADRAFQDCNALIDTGLENNKTVTTIGVYAFAGCTSLTDTGLAYNTTVKSIGNEAFASCIMMEDTILIENDLSRWGKNTFSFAGGTVYYLKTAIGADSFVEDIYYWKAVPYVISNISVKTSSKTNYVFDDSYDPTNLVITVDFVSEDGTPIPSRDVAYNDNQNDFTFDKSDNLQVADDLVTIAYGGKTTTLDITVSKIMIDLPTVNKSITYDKNSHSITEVLNGYDGTLMLLAGDSTKTDAGTYTGKVQLVDSNNYAWMDGTSNPKDLDWIINKMEVDVPSVAGSFTENGKTQKLLDIMKNYDDKNVILTGTIEESVSGKYVAIATLNDTRNYKFKDTEETFILLNWEIKANPGVPDSENKSPDTSDKGTSDFINRPSTKPQFDGEVADTNAIIATGDTSNVNELFILLLFSLSCGLIVLTKKKRYNK